jgi:hypothetical protein
MVIPKFSYYLFSLLFATISLVGCKDKDSDSYIVSQHDRTKAMKRQHGFFYSAFNLVLDTSSALYFHDKDSLLNCCDTGEDYNYPDFIGLQPSDLKLITDKEFEHIIDSVTHLPKTDKFSIQIAVYADTLKNGRFALLLEKMERRHLDNFDVRLATEEETEVLKAKKQNRTYDFYKVNWKSRFSNMSFPPPPPTEEN